MQQVARDAVLVAMDMNRFLFIELVRPSAESSSESHAQETTGLRLRRESPDQLRAAPA
jgi:hypothetical protein